MQVISNLMIIHAVGHMLHHLQLTVGQPRIMAFVAAMQFMGDARL